MFRDSILVSVLVAGGALSSGCGDDEESTSATAGATTVPDLPQPAECASQQFGDSEGPGVHYGCDGSVEGELRFDVCDDPTDGDFNCDPTGATEGSSKTILIDSAETEGADGEIPFASDDPTEGPLVEACCEDSIETAQNGEEVGDNACLVDCAHAACLDALERFKALVADPPDDACPGGVAGIVCKNNIKQSVEYWKAVLEMNFDACVKAVASPDPDDLFILGNPGCVMDEGPLKGGCFAHGVLDLKCVTAEIDLETGMGTCTQAKSQPLEKSRQACEIAGGEVEISDGTALVFPSVQSGTATTSHFNCGEALCTFMIDGMNLIVEDVDYGSSDLEDIQVELLYPAAGQSDGTDVEFPPGSIRVRITGNMVDVTGPTPFDVVAGNTVIAYGVHDLDSLSLDDVIFEADFYTFTASIEESECEAL